MKNLTAADLFCGAGGTSIGAELTGCARVVFALNHWQVAVNTHSANFPGARHVNSRLENTHPSESPPMNILFASPECTHHSRARGGKPTSDQQRSGAWHVLPWIEHHRPTFVVIENVTEFRDWGPVAADGRPLKSKQGLLFDSWLMSIRSMGYRVEHTELNAADFGAATSRNRLFVVARKGGRSPQFPSATHAKLAGGLFGLPRWRSAAEIIDWSIPCPSIFGRKRPLADKTLLRIEAGLRRFVGPFVARCAHGDGSWGHKGSAVSESLGTLTTSKDFALAMPFPYIVPNFGEAPGQEPRTHAIGDALPTVTSHGAGAVAIPFLAEVNHDGDARLGSMDSTLGSITTKNGRAIVVPFQFQLIGRGAGNSRSIGNPVPTVVATRENHGVIIPWLSQFYGNETQSRADVPVPTITTKDRHSLCVARFTPADWPEPTSDAMRTLQATMRELGVADVGFRMLSNPELSLAQGFPSSYIFTGTKSDVTRQIGNSVSPSVAKAITMALAG